jgi:hypothetical protein
MCHEDQHLTDALSLVLLGICTAFKANLQASVAELVYGESLRILGELLTPTTDPVETAHLISQLGQHMALLRPVPAGRHASPATFVHNCLQKCTRLPPSGHNAPGFGAPYSGPYQVLLEKENTATPRARQARHHVNRYGQAGLHTKWD